VNRREFTLVDDKVLVIGTADHTWTRFNLTATAITVICVVLTAIPPQLLTKSAEVQVIALPVVM
jgi:hypothetical protein